MLLTRTKDYYRDYDPYLSDLSFQPAKQFVDPTFYSAKGGLAKLAHELKDERASQIMAEYVNYRDNDMAGKVNPSEDSVRLIPSPIKVKRIRYGRIDYGENVYKR